MTVNASSSNPVIAMGSTNGIHGEAGINKAAKDMAHKVSRGVSDTVNGTRPYLADFTHTAKEAVGAPVAAAAEISNQVGASTQRQAKSVVGAAVGVAQSAVNKVGSVAQQAAYTSAAAAGYTLGASQASLAATVNVSKIAGGYTVSMAAKAAKLYIGTALAVVNAGTGAVTGVSAFAADKANNVACSLVNTSRSVVTYTASTAHNTAKRVLPGTIVNKAEQSYASVTTAATHPMQTAQGVLPKPIYGALDWSVHTAVSTTDRTLSTVTNTKERVVGTGINTVNRVMCTLDAVDKHYVDTAQHAWGNIKASFPATKQVMQQSPVAA